MWVMTFHAACARMLRADGDKLGYTRQFTTTTRPTPGAWSSAASTSLGVDTKRYTPGAIHNQISDAKNKLRDAEAYKQLVGSYFEQTVADAFAPYERELHRMNAMDFDDLLVNAVNVLTLFQEVRDRYSAASATPGRRVPGHQRRPVPLAPTARGEHRNLAVVGDDAQRWSRRRSTMADGSLVPTETF